MNCHSSVSLNAGKPKCETVSQFVLIGEIRVKLVARKIKNYQTNPFWNSQFPPQTKGILRVIEKNLMKNEPILADRRIRPFMQRHLSIPRRIAFSLIWSALAVTVLAAGLSDKEDIDS